MKSQASAKIKREEADLSVLMLSLKDNPIPWAVVVRVTAPIIARLAVRYAMKRLKRGMSEERVTRIGQETGDFIASIIEKRTGGEQ